MAETDIANDVARPRGDILLEVSNALVRLYKDFYGKPAKGWLSSSLRGTVNTPGILKENGCLYKSQHC